MTEDEVALLKRLGFEPSRLRKTRWVKAAREDLPHCWVEFDTKTLEWVLFYWTGSGVVPKECQLRSPQLTTVLVFAEVEGYTQRSWPV